jgi:hypothetical protein
MRGNHRSVGDNWLASEATRFPRYAALANKKYVVDLKGTAVLLLPGGRGSWLADDGLRSGPETKYHDLSSGLHVPDLLPLRGRSSASQLPRPSARI